MEIGHDSLKQSLRRLSIRLLELRAWCDRDRRLITEAEFRADPGANWTKLRPDEPWPALGTPVEIRFDAMIPADWAGLPVHGRFRLGGRDGIGGRFRRNEQSGRGVSDAGIVGAVAGCRGRVMCS